jgi:hypothetical protein
MTELSRRTLKAAIVVLSVCVLALATIVWWMSTAKQESSAASIENGSLPFAVVRVKIPKSSYEGAVAAIREFADTNGFAMRVAATTPSGGNVSIDLWRSDIKILGDNALLAADFSFGLYKNGPASPATDNEELKERFIQTVERVSGTEVSRAK